MDTKNSSQNQKPIKEYLDDFLQWLEIEKGVSVATQINYQRFLKKFFEWLKKESLSQLKPKDLTKNHIWNYRIYLARQNLKKATQNYYLIALRSFLSFFIEREIDSLPPEVIKLPKDKDSRKIKFLTREEFEKLTTQPNTKTIQGLRDRAILEILFSTGVRIQELVSLNRNQINFKNDYLELTIVGKGRRPRTVYFSKRALFWLKKYLDKRKDTNLALFISHKKNQYGSNSRLTPRSIQKMLKKYLIKAGLSYELTPHSIRHSFATDLLMHGVDIRIVQEFLGHKSIQATQIYTHITNPKLKEIHKKVHKNKKGEE